MELFPAMAKDPRYGLSRPSHIAVLSLITSSYNTAFWLNVLASSTNALRSQ